LVQRSSYLSTQNSGRYCKKGIYDKFTIQLIENASVGILFVDEDPVGTSGGD